MVTTALLLAALNAPMAEPAPGPLAAGPERAPRVLLLTHSAGFVHDVVKRPEGGRLSVAEQAFVLAATSRYEIVPSQSCALLTAEGLSGFDAVVFYTTGELPVPEGGAQALLDWVRGGGAFVGIHCAADTFHEHPPYQRMLGGVFDGHPWNQEVGVIVADGTHPAMAGLPATFRTRDEIYQFRDFFRHPLAVLLTLDTSTVDVSKGSRADGDYALAWARDFGRGRVFYTALGHDERQWRDERFQQHVLAGLAWALEGPDHPVQPPPGATILIGRDDVPDADALAAAWRHRGGEPFAWKPVDGAVEVVAGTGDLVSRATFGDALLHVEFRTPLSPPEATGQARGNSGVYVQGRYEVQVLDSFGVEPLALGDCGAIYGQHLPAVDANRPPERWQTYDIRFTAPRFDAGGARTAPARMSVWHNGVLIHDAVELAGPTGGALGPEAPTGPLLLQDHGNPVRYRNVWWLPLEE